jgi:hypothetical protein
VFAHDFPQIAGVYVDDPVAVHNGWIRDAGGAAFVAAAAFVLALAVVLGRRSPRALALASVLFVLAGALATSGVAWSRLLTGRSPSSREISAAPTVVLNWVDTVVPKGADVAIVPYAGYQYWGPNALLWWDVEFWNKSVNDAYVVDARWDYAPFPHHTMKVDRATGAIASTEDAPPYVVADHTDARLRLIGATRNTNYGLDVLEVERPYRAAWISSGLDPDGWTRPGRRASIHVFGDAPTNVSLLRGDGKATSVCGTHDIPLPDAATGTAPALPVGPDSVGTRSVGVRVTAVETRSSC